MDEFKPEDELKPDTSDRRPTRPRKTSSAPKAKTPVSRQRMMMGIGVLVLLLLVIGIGSALKGPDNDKPAAQSGSGAASGGGTERNIDLSGSTPTGGQSNGAPNDATAMNGGDTASQSPQPVSVPPVSSTPTQAAPIESPQNQQRVELPGDLNNALTNQQGEMDSAAQGAMGGSSLPTAPATVNGSGAGSVNSNQVVSAPRQSSAQSNVKSTPTHKPAASQSSANAKQSGAPAAKQSSKPAASSAHSAPAASQSTPGGSYTLQLSSASRSDTLNAWAKKQNLSNYHVYQTTRNGQPWYVLVSGAYATPADAKRAVASLPAEVQAKKPWVKPVSQVKKEAGR
ncbi:SPOR domain-containing protein [Mixta gaviniae]|uniref:Cell division protein DamX n=1 Tax=Mixta gaviniae TaxID=665914 RepID=A0A2L0IBM0_9GAMM|nr:SPOR domain-containing protein [Mixta gaviniae]AUX91963.1 SPOR domain-containing protein [Mixta gaviniae]